MSSSSWLTKDSHQRYFDATQPIPSIINRDRFFCLATEIPIPHQVNALRYAVAMAGASLSDDLPHLESLCYNSTRHYIELAEREDDGASFLNLEMLQALILIERHEFMEATTSARAWMTHGRTMRLVKLLGLHVMDADSAPMELNRLCIPHSASPSPTDLDERRRTFWVAFNLDLFIAAMTNTPPSIEVDEVWTRQPVSDSRRRSLPWPSLFPSAPCHGSPHPYHSGNAHSQCNRSSRSCRTTFKMVSLSLHLSFPPL